MPLLRRASLEPLATARAEARLLQWSGIAGAPRGILDRMLDRPNVPPGLANRIVGGTGDAGTVRIG